MSARTLSIARMSLYRAQQAAAAAADDVVEGIGSDSSQGETESSNDSDSEGSMFDGMEAGGMLDSQASDIDSGSEPGGAGLDAGRAYDEHGSESDTTKRSTMPEESAASGPPRTDATMRFGPSTVRR